MLDEPEEQEFYPVFQFLTELGFSEVVATQITLHALLRHFSASVEEIKAASEDCGYALPLLTMAVPNYKDRN